MDNYRYIGYYRNIDKEQGTSLAKDKGVYHEQQYTTKHVRRFNQ